MKKNQIVGIDEVGRGPIAGPVVVCSFCSTSQDLVGILENIALPIRDSKKLTKKQREKWFEYLLSCKKEGKCDFAVSLVQADQIDKMGIVKCIQKALDSSLDKITLQTPQIFLDGGLKARKEHKNQETIIKGDETYPVISLASIIAKVSRDRLMEKYAIEFPNYGFEKNAGYGTKAHYEAIKKYGLTLIHRKTFIH